MYFDVEYYWRVLRHVWSLKQWPGRARMLFRLLALVPLETAFHTVCFLLDYAFFPGLWRQKVQAPVFIVGHARSGTTLTHRLLAADGERFSYFLYWEIFFPSLLQKRVIRWLGRIDRRWLGGAVEQRLRRWDDKTFGPFRHIHDMSLWNSEEDQFVMRAAFVTQHWALEIPLMDRIDLFHLDRMPPGKRRRWMHHYRECVKRQLLLNGGDKVHLSKNPVMCGWVESLIERFPDARFVVPVRNPNQCIPSTLKLLEGTWKAKGWEKADYAGSLRAQEEICLESFTHPRDVLARHPKTLQIAVDYRQLTGEPRNTVHHIYQALGMEVSTSFDAWLAAQEDRERSHSSRFRYSIDDYELTTQRIESELSWFFDHYGWPREAIANAQPQPGDGGLQ